MTAYLLLFLAAAQPPPSEVPLASEEAQHLRDIRQLTRGFQRAGEAYFSPDARRIIFQAVTDDYPFYQIFTMKLDASGLNRVSTGRGKTTCSYFRPDGKKIIFASSHLDPKLDETEARGRREADEEARARAESAKAKKPYRGRRYQWDFDVHMDIFEANPEGTALVRLTTAPGYDAEGAYSPDGNQVVFCSLRDGDGEIYIMNADGSAPRRLTHRKGYDGGPFFSPDGKHVIFRGDPEENDHLQLFVINADGTGERQLTRNQAVNWGPYWHPDGRHIIFASSLATPEGSGRPNYDLFLMDVDTTRTERITFNPAADVLPVFSPDGKQVMWTSTRSADRTSQIFLADWIRGSRDSISRTSP